MAAKKEDLDQLNVIIRSTLLSQPSKMTVLDLKKDFKENYGKEFPFSQFGFKSFLDYLCSIPKIVHVTDVRHPNPIVLPISSENSQHIEQLIARQNTRNKRKVTQRRPPPRFSNFNKQAPPLMSVNPFHSRNDNHHYNSRYCNNTPNVKNSTPNVKNSTPNVKNSTPNVKNSTPNVKNSKDHCQEKLNHKELAEPEDECSKNKNDVKSASNLRPQYSIIKSDSFINSDQNKKEENCTSSVVNSEMSSGINESSNCTATNSRNTLDDIFEDIKNLVDGNPWGISVQRVNIEILSNEQYRRALTDNMISNVYELLFNYRDVFTVRHDRIYAKNPVTTEGPTGYPQPIVNSVDFCDTNIRNNSEKGPIGNLQTSSSPIIDDEDLISDRLISNFRHLLSIHPEGIMCSDLPKCYEKEFHVQLNIRDYGYRSIIEMVGQLPNIFHYVRKSNCSDWMLYDAQCKPDSDSNTNNLLELKNYLRLYDQNLKRLLALESKDSFDSEFLETCKIKYDHDIVNELKALGFKSIKSYLEEIQRIREEDELNNSRKQQLRKSTVPALPGIEYLMSELFPPDVCDKDFQLERVELEVSSIIEVHVTQVTNPSCFWMVMEKYWNKLLDLMDDLETFYNNVKDFDEKYFMPKCTITEGQLCVAPYGVDFEWHRARILSCAYIDKVKVDYIDYGTIGMVDKSQLKFLHKDFAVLPQQYIKAKLFGICPVNDSWSKQDGIKFLEIVYDKTFCATLKTLNSEALITEIILYETRPSCEHDFVVNSHLVDLGLAKYLKPRVNKVKEDRNVLNYSTDEISPLHFQQRLLTPPVSPQRSTPVTNHPNLTKLNQEYEENYTFNCNTDEMSGLYSSRMLQTPSPVSSHRTISPMNHSVLSIGQEQSVYNNENRAFSLHSLQNSPTPSLTSQQTLPPPVYKSTLRPPHKPPPGFSEKDLIKNFQNYSTLPSTSFPQNEMLNMTYNNIGTNSTYQTRLDNVNSPATQLYAFQLYNLLSTVAQRSLMPNLLQPQSLPSAYVNPVLNQSYSTAKMNEKIENQEATGYRSDENDGNKPNILGSYCESNNDHKIRTIWSPVEIKKNFNDIINTSGSHSKSVSSLSDISYSSCVEETNYERPSISLNTMPNDFDSGKTPDNWEERFDFESKLDCATTSINNRQTKWSSGENTPNRNSSIRTKNVYSTNNEDSNIEDARMIVPAGVKVSSHPNKVISLDTIKLLEEQENPKGPLRLIEFGNFCLHIMRIKGTTMVSTLEVLRTFTSFSGVHIVMQLLDVRRIKLPFSDLHINENKDLFAEIKKTHLHQLLKNSGSYYKQINIVPLASVPQLLSILNVKTPGLFNHLNKIINQYKGNEEWC